MDSSSNNPDPASPEQEHAQTDSNEQQVPVLDQEAQISPMETPEDNEPQAEVIPSSTSETEPLNAVKTSTDSSPKTDNQQTTIMPSADTKTRFGRIALASKVSAKHKHFWRTFAIVSGVLILLMGASAAAFFTVYLPRQPWYILDTALRNTLNQTQFTASVVVNDSSTSKSSPPFKLTSSSAVNLNTKAFNENLGINVKLNTNKSTTIPISVRFVSNDLYFKVNYSPSALSLLNNLTANSSSSSLLGVLPGLLTALNNHWFTVGGSLLDQSTGLKCLLNSSWVLSSSDSSYLSSNYLKKPFFSVKSSSSATVNGAASDELSVVMNDNGAASYIKDLSNLQAFKTYQKCSGSKNNKINVSSLADGKQTPMTIWINKASHLINKVEVSSNSKSFNGSVEVTINYSKVSVIPPANAESVMQLFTQIEQQALSNPQLQNTLSKTGL